MKLCDLNGGYVISIISMVVINNIFKCKNECILIIKFIIFYIIEFLIGIFLIDVYGYDMGVEDVCG